MEQGKRPLTTAEWESRALVQGKCPMTGTPLRICFCGHVEYGGHRPPLGAVMTLRDSWDLGEFVDAVAEVQS